MIPKKRISSHPGQILSEEFLKPSGITQVKLAERIQVPTQRVNEIVKGKRGITPMTAWLFSQAFCTSPQFWLNLQTNYDLSINRPKRQIKQFNLSLTKECI